MYGSIIRKLRKENGMSLEEMTKALEYKSISAVAMIEREERELTVDTLIKLATLFNVSTDFILGINQSEMNFENIKLENEKLKLLLKDILRNTELLEKLLKDNLELINLEI